MSPALCIDHGKSARYAYTRRDGKPVAKHRLVYADSRGIPLSAIDGLVVRHKCDNNRCLQPDHLEIGTQADNIKDMWVRTRAPPHQKHYAAISQEYVRGSKECGQVALAAKYGVAQATVSRIVNGTNRMANCQPTFIKD
jgi:hypothetical protein